MSKKAPHEKKEFILADFDSTRDPLTEAFRMLRLQVETWIDSGNSKGHTILITSALQSEGKTMVSANLARVCAIAKVKTLLMDTDLRKPKVHEVFGIPRSPGLTDFLMDDNPESLPVVPTDVPELSIIPAGKFIKHTTEILGSPVFSRFLEKLKSQYGLIVIDSPPAGITADPGVIARKVDSIYLVVRSGATNTRTVEKAVRTLVDLGGTIRGVIMTRIDAKRDRYYYYHYYPHYYSKYYKDEDQEK